jgi:phage terminase large subunit-like protein
MKKKTPSRTRNSPSKRAPAVATQYAKDVLAGKIPAGKYVRLACERFFRDLERSEKNDSGFPYVFDHEAADRIVRFMHILPHVKGRWAARHESLELQPWQCFIECNLFGWLHRETKLRRFRESYEEEPRKSGKSTRVGGRALYLLTADHEKGAEIYSGATTEKQAMEVFRPAWQMMHEMASFRSDRGIKLAGTPNNPGTIYITEDMSRFEPMIGKPGDGSSPHGAIIDEYHEHDTDHMVDAMKTGMGAREQPMLSIITTAGSNLGGPCYEKRRDMIRILEGYEADETQFGIIYGIDEGDPWDDRASLIKANPNYNISVYADFLDSMLAQARRSAAKQNAFRTKHLNEWVGARVAWMNMVAWQKQKQRQVYADFKGCRCWLGCDLATKVDVSALIALFEKDGNYFCVPRFYVPEAALEDNEKYREFVTGGDMIATPGNMTDYEYIEDDIVRIAKQVTLQDAAFDPAQASYLITRLQKARIPVIDYPQTVRNLSEPMKEVEALTLSGKFWHDGNRAMTWMIGNVAAKIDAKEHIFPRKENINDPLCKIDGAVALIMAMGRALLMKSPPEYRVHFI